jgi:nitroreductase
MTSTIATSAHPVQQRPGALEAVRARRSWSKVTDLAPTHDELVTLVSAAGRVADHSSLRPWRLIELRGDDRERLGAAIAAAQDDDKPSTKPLRAPLLIAVVASYRKSDKVPRWEQEAVASGVAHVLSLLLDEAGWGVIWRTGGYTRARAVAKMHGLAKNEELLGWLYVGGKPPGARAGSRREVDARKLISPPPSAAVAERAEKKKTKKKDKKKKRR